MKRTNYISFIIAGILLLIGSDLAAQKNYKPERELTTESNSLNYKIPGNQYYNMIVPAGSIFLFNDWEDGYLTLVNGDRYDDLSLKYNLYTDELIHINNRSVSMIQVDKNTIAEFGFYLGDNKDMIFRQMYFPKYPGGNYFFEILYEGNLTLGVRHRSMEEQTSTYKDAYGMLRNSVYNIHEYYYVIFPENQFERFRLNRRSFADVFPDHKKEVKRLLRQNHLRINNTSEAIQAIKLVEEQLSIR